MENEPKKSPAKHTVQQGKVYVALKNGRLTRNYVVLGGKRVYVNAEPGTELTKAQAEKSE